MTADVSPADALHLERCVQLAAEALDNGDEPFGSVLVDREGTVLAEARNRETTDHDPTAHPELMLVQWAIARLAPEERAAVTVYTSGEHCPMCAAAHGWAGLGPIVAAATSAQLAEWCASWGLPAGPVVALPIGKVAPEIEVTAPVAPFDARMRTIHERGVRMRRPAR